MASTQSHKYDLTATSQNMTGGDDLLIVAPGTTGKYVQAVKKTIAPVSKASGFIVFYVPVTSLIQENSHCSVCICTVKLVYLIIGCKVSSCIILSGEN